MSKADQAVVHTTIWEVANDGALRRLKILDADLLGAMCDRPANRA